MTAADDPFAALENGIVGDTEETIETISQDKSRDSEFPVVDLYLSLCL